MRDTHRHMCILALHLYQEAPGIKPLACHVRAMCVMTLPRHAQLAGFVAPAMSPLPAHLQPPVVQGPPGTGKTRTILGLLGVVLHAQAASPAADGAQQAQQASTPAQILASLSLSGAPWVHGLPNARWGLAFSAATARATRESGRRTGLWQAANCDEWQSSTDPSDRAPELVLAAAAPTVKLTRCCAGT